MDSETRFLISNHISQGREIGDARAIFAKAKKMAGTKPDFVITDGLQSYRNAFKKEFFTLKNPRTQHIRNVGFKDKTNNNKIERFHGTFRERDKVLRGLKKEETAKVIAEGFRAYYNFLRPHQALENKTPAKEANINLELERNKWLSLIRKSVKQ
jgi:transposase-like protein